MTPSPHSPAESLVLRLAADLGADAAHEALNVMLRNLSTLELAGLEHNWPFWRRPSQNIPNDGWGSIGLMGGRGAGKTHPCSSYIVQRAEEKPIRIALVGPTDEDVRRIMIEGKAGLLARSPPWFKATYEPGASGGRVTWPNGSMAFQYSSVAPEHFRGPEHGLAWLTEVGAWQESTAMQAWENLDMGLRSDNAQLLWDSSPRTVPLVALLIARSKADPQTHRIIPSRMVDNWANLPVRYVAERLAKYAGTRFGRQELDGEYLENIEGAIFQAGWFKREHEPKQWARRALSVDPAATPESAKRDETGIICGGVGDDGRIYISRDMSARHGSDATAGWPFVAVGAYLADKCDVMILETNMGHDMVVGLIQAAARDKGVGVRILAKEERPPRHDPKTVHVREVRAKRSKDDRAMPISALCEKGRVVFVVGADLTKLEEQLAAFVPKAKKSPDRVDAMVHLAWELAGSVFTDEPDLRAGFRGMSEIAAGLTAGTPAGARRAGGIAAMLPRGGGGWGGRI